MIKNGWKEKQKLVLWKGMTEETDWGQGVWVVVQQQESIVLCSGWDVESPSWNLWRIRD